jgi:hypothetical protein
MAEERKAGKLAKGGQPHQRKRKAIGSRKDPVELSLAARGVDKHLADRARKAALSTEKYLVRRRRQSQMAIAVIK